MTNNVVRITGDGRLPDESSTAPIDDIVKMLESALEQAQRGEIRAVAIAAIKGGGWGSVRWCFGEANQMAFVGVTAKLAYDVLADMNDED